MAQGVGQALEESIVDRGDVDELVLIAAVWVNPEADDEDAVFANNRIAMLEALRNAVGGLPIAADFIAAAQSPFNPFYSPA